METLHTYRPPVAKDQLLADGLLAVITGGDFDGRYFDRLGEIWEGNPEFALSVAGLQKAIPLTRDSIRFETGNAYGNLSGITPIVEYLDEERDAIKRTRLTVDQSGAPNFTLRLED